MCAVSVRPDSSEPSATEIGLAVAHADEVGENIDATGALPSTDDAFADLDPYVLASLRTSADEDALAAALVESLTPTAEVVDLAARRRSARSRAVLRAA